MRDDLHKLLEWLESRPDFNANEPLYVATREAATRLGDVMTHTHYASLSCRGEPTRTE